MSVVDLETLTVDRLDPWDDDDWCHFTSMNDPNKAICGADLRGVKWCNCEDSCGSMCPKCEEHAPVSEQTMTISELLEKGWIYP